MHFQPIHSFEWQVGNFHDPSAEGTLGKVARQNLRHVIYLTWITRTLGNYCPILQLEYIRNHICWQTSNTGCWLASNLYWFDGWFSLHLHWKYIYTSSRQNCWSWPTFVMSRIWRRIASSIWDLSQKHQNWSHVRRRSWPIQADVNIDLNQALDNQPSCRIDSTHHQNKPLTNNK